MKAEIQICKGEYGMDCGPCVINIPGTSLSEIAVSVLSLAGKEDMNARLFTKPLKREHYAIGQKSMLLLKINFEVLWTK